MITFKSEDERAAWVALAAHERSAVAADAMLEEYRARCSEPETVTPGMIADLAEAVRLLRGICGSTYLGASHYAAATAFLARFPAEVPR